MTQVKPRLGQRVHFTRKDHKFVSEGMTGFIENILLKDSDQFFVLTDDSGFFGWTTFASWELTGEPDEILSEGFIALRTSL